MKKPGDETLYLLGIVPGTRISMTLNGVETRSTANEAGLATIPFSKTSAGNTQLSR